MVKLALLDNEDVVLSDCKLELTSGITIEPYRQYLDFVFYTNGEKGFSMAYSKIFKVIFYQFWMY